jgi:hypothetical protein
MSNVIATYPKLSHDWLKHETDRAISRDTVMIKAASGKLDTGTVLGRIALGAATVAAKAGGNTGNGLLTLDVTTPVLAAAVAGIYTVRCITAAANAATFRVERPDGVVIGDVDLGATFADGVKFVIADGATDFVVGDGFNITVAAGSSLYVPCNLTATDGSQTPAAILKDYTDASGVANVRAVAVVGFAEVVMAELSWHASFDSLPKKRAAMTTLALQHIKSRGLA